MEYVYAAMLLHSAGKKIDDASVTAVLKSAGVTADATRVKALTAALDGVNIEEAISSAAFAPVAAGGGGAAAAASDAPKMEAKKEEPAVSEEEASAGLSALFG